MTSVLKQLSTKVDDRMLRLFHLFSSLTGNHESELFQVLKYATELVNMDIGLVNRIEGESVLVQAIFSKQNTDLITGSRFPFNGSITEHVINQDKITISRQSHNKMSWLKGYGLSGPTTFIGVPIVVEGRSIGTLEFRGTQDSIDHLEDFDQVFVLYLSQWLGTYFSRRRKEELLREQNEMLQRMVREQRNLADFVVHDLRAPLGNLYQLHELWKLEESREEQLDISSLMNKSFSTIFTLVNDIHEMNLLDNGQPKLNLKLVDGETIKGNLKSTFSQIASSKDIDFQIGYTKDFKLLTDQRWFMRCLSNLVSSTNRQPELK